MDQLQLFITSATETLRLAVAATTAAGRRQASVKAAKALRERKTVLQLDLWGGPLEVRIWVAKRKKPGPARKIAKAVADIFAFAAQGKTMALRRGTEERATCSVVIRENGVTRHIAQRIQETEAWAEKERIRRAKQKPPRPPKAAAKFRMKNSRAWDAEKT